MSNFFQQWTSTVNSLLSIFCSTSSPDYSCCGTGLVARWHGQTLSVCVLYHDCKAWFQLWSHLMHLRQNTFFSKIYNWKRPLDFSGSLTIRCSMVQNFILPSISKFIVKHRVPYITFTFLRRSYCVSFWCQLFAIPLYTNRELLQYCWEFHISVAHL